MAGTFGYGAVLKINGTTVSEITNISGPELSADTLDATTHSSADGYREFVQGLRDGGEISIEGNLDYDNNVSVIKTQFDTSSVVSASIVLPTSPSNTEWVANVITTGISTEAPHDEIIPYSATFKITGKPTLQEI